MNAVGEQRPDVADILLTGKEVEQTTGVSSRTIQRLVAQGLMPAPLKLGSQNRWSRAAIETRLAAGCPAVRKEA